MPDTVVYLYAVTWPLRPGALDRVSGIAGTPVRAVVGDRLTAVVGSVPADEFDPADADERMADLAWLTAVARAHHRVVDDVGSVAVVAPIALGTVFHDDERVHAVLAERGETFVTVLRELTGRDEWGVKAFAPRTPSPGGRAASGTEYLRQRRAAIGHAERELDGAYRSADVLHRNVSRAAVRARLHRVHDPALTGRPEPMVLNGAYLVDADRVDEWHAAVAAAGDDLAVEVTGPWVPYSFADPGTP